MTQANANTSKSARPLRVLLDFQKSSKDYPAPGKPFPVQSVPWAGELGRLLGCSELVPPSLATNLTAAPLGSEEASTLRSS